MFSNETKTMENLPDVSRDELYVSLAKDQNILHRDRDAKMEEEKDPMLLIKWQPLFQHPLPVSEEKFRNDRFIKKYSNLPPEKRIGMAAAEGLAWVVEEFYIRGCPHDVANEQGYQPLHLAASLGHVPVVRALLNMGCDPNAQTTAGFTALYLAASGPTDQHREAAALLAERGGLPEVRAPRHPAYLGVFDVDVARPADRAVDAVARCLERPHYPGEL